MRRVLGLLGMMCLLLTPGGGAVRPAWAGLDEALAAYRRGDYATALREVRPLAERGDTRAQVALGALYEKGKGVPQNYTEAVKWYRRAAEQGDANGENNLATMYAKGQGMPQDYAEAVKWYRLAASRVIPPPSTTLATSTPGGRGCRRTLAKR